MVKKQIPPLSTFYAPVLFRHFLTISQITPAQTSLSVSNHGFRLPSRNT